MATTYTIELRAGKLVATDTSGVAVGSVGTAFMPGDIVSGGVGGGSGFVLVKRDPCVMLGIVKDDTGRLYVCGAGPFEPALRLSGIVGDRYVLRFHDTAIDVLGRYSGAPTDDAACLLAMYAGDDGHLTADGMLGFGPHLYSRDEVVCHDDLDTFTIDPASSVDFDDALSVVGNIIYVHIVDIASASLSALSLRRLKERCLTLYLSNEHTEHLLCDADVAAVTLGAGVQRPVITVKVTVGDDGMVVAHEIYKSTIVVKRRYNYDQVAAMLNAGSAGPAIDFLNNLTTVRASDVVYNISLPSVRLRVDCPSGTAVVTTEVTNDAAHSLVACAMILANLVVSKHLSDAGLVLPNRFHDTLRGFVPPASESTGDVGVDSFIMVKRYARACYSVDQKGHFGLGLTDYVHFTSPMRRYADVLVHRLLAGWNGDGLAGSVDWLNKRASKVRLISDLYTSWKVGRTLQVGSPGRVCITDVKPAGIMWFMPSHSLNGFVHVSALLPAQRWNFVNGTLQGSATITVGTWANARLVAVDPVTYAVTLSITV
jgi:hypothetical protein